MRNQLDLTETHFRAEIDLVNQKFLLDLLVSGFRALASSAPDAGLPPFERHLANLIRLLILVQTAALALRVLVLPGHSAIGAKPAILWFLLPIAAILLAVPWGRLARKPLLLLAGLLVVMAIRSVTSLQSVWIAGFEPWWTMPFVTMTMAITVGAAQLLTPPERSSHPWRLNLVQWALLALFTGVLAAVCWATWNGPGSEPREALLMNRTLWSTLIVAVVAAVLIKAHRYRLAPAQWQPATAWCLVGISLAHILISLPILDWLAANSMSRRGFDLPVTFWVWAGLAAVGVIPQSRRYFFFVSTTVLLFWVSGTAFTKPQLAAAGLPFLATVCALLAGGQRKLLSVLAWGLVLAVFAAAPQTNATQVFLFGLSGTGVLGLMMVLVHGLNAQADPQAQPADETSHFAPPIWIVPAAIAAGVLPGFVFWLAEVPAGNATVQLQMSLLVALLIGGGAYIGLRARCASVWRREQQKSVAQLQGVLDASQTGYSLFRADGRFVWANQAVAALGGGTPEQARGMNLFDFPPARKHLSKEVIEKLLLTGEALQVAYQGTSIHGVELDVTYFISRVMLDGEAHLLIEYKDLRHEHALERAAQQQLQGVLDASDTAFSLWREDGSFVWCNRANLSLTGDTLEEHGAINLFRHPGFTGHDSAQLIRNALNQDTKAQIEFQLPRRSGDQIDIRATLGRVMLGEQPHLLLQKVDLSRERARERELAAHLNAIDRQVIVNRFDQHDRLTYVNDAYLAYTGYSREEVIGQSHRIINPKEEAEARFARFDQDLQAGGFVHRTLWQNVSKSGEPRWCSLVAVKLPPNAAGQIETMILRTDLTEMVKANREAEAARVQAQTQRLLGERKDEFVAAVSHELRTPLNGILGMLQGMERRIQDSKTRELLHNARHASQQLLTQVNDILDFSRLRDGKLELHPAPVRMRVLFDSVCSIMQPLADEQGIALRVEADSCADALVQLDAHRFSQVLINLLSNGIKFTPNGAVFLRARCEPAEPGQIQMHLEVADTGIGMSAQFLPHLFERFSQADTQEGGRRGTGLGMAITRELVELMGGRIEVVSELGKGTTFTVRLVLATSDQIDSLVENENENEATRLSGLRVLYADDDRVNRMVVQTLLEDTGVQLELVEDGQQAVNRVLSPEGHFDLVLMDLQMPVLDGLAATRVIRVQRSAQQLPIIGLSAHAQLVHRERAAQAGMSGFLTKPVMRDELIRTILSQLPATQSTPGGSAPGRSAAQGSQGESTPHGSSATQKDTNTADSQQPDSAAMALDVELMLKQMHSSVGLAREVLPVVLQETPGTIKQLAEAVGKSDSDAVQKLAHLLKGRAASIAAVTMSEHCAALDLSARAGQLEKFAFLFNTICEDYLALEAEIKAWLAAHELVTSAKRPGLND